MDAIAFRINMLRNHYDGPGLISLLAIFMTFFSAALLYDTLVAHASAFWTPDRMTRFKQWLSTTSADDRTEAEKMVDSYFLTAMCGFVIGGMYVLVEWTRMPILGMLALFMVGWNSPRSWRMRVYEAFNSCVDWSMTELDRELGNSDDETLTGTDASDREKMEIKDEESTDADDTVDTDDPRSSGLNTPSETESSHSSGPYTPTNNVHTGGAAISEASVREATRTGFRPELAASYLNAFILPPAVKDPRKKFSSLQDVLDWSSPNPPTTTPVQTREQIPCEENMTTYSGMLSDRWENRDQPRLTSYVVKAAHQPLDIIVLEIKKGVDFRERMLVRMYRTTPFIQLKNKLRNKDEKDGELVVRTPKRDFPVFDNETPSSVSHVHRVFIIAVERVRMLMSCSSRSKDWFAALVYIGLATYAGYAEITGSDWKGSSGESLVERGR
jgi:hypothetical protein